MKIGIASADWSNTVRTADGLPAMGGSGWARVGQYQQFISPRVPVGALLFSGEKGIFGVHCWTGSTLDHWDCDVILMQRFMHDTIPEQVLRARAAGQVVIQDIDDWYWGLNPENLAFKMTHPKYNEKENIKHYQQTVVNSSGVLTSTDFLNEQMSEWNDFVITTENTVEFSKFTPRHHKASPDSGDLRIGWVGSTAHRSGDVETMKGLANQFQGMGYRWCHTGHIPNPAYPPLAGKLGLDEEDVETTEFLLPENYPDGFNFDVGLVPLNLIRFNDAKSFIKGLEYTAAGVPFLAAPSREYRRLLDEYGVGFRLKKPADWVKAARKLRDPDYRQEVADANIAALSGRYDVSQGAIRLHQALIDIARANPS